ncbi:superoxide dismutase [Sphingobacterium sp. UDSM-2020]|uniref:superoxide dismutase n=1 Tax=Sphingobacterium sp. UDSM-2020 TaxID=2795738 RepID=UPI00193610C2|nr:superoxide dismutase [Sphingobacterium sp. UDSM-2020]QQD16140.1 superoxide dismutase [Sphingobacterium sp. UDSM-2020]
MSKFELPALLYTYEALEPHFDTQTMTIHHSRHHQVYVDNLNKALEQDDIKNLELPDLIKHISKYSPAVRNNGGGHYNHSLFWSILSPTAKTTPEGRLVEAINRSFGSLDQLKEEIKKLGLGQFGSGWAWLFVSYSGALAISSTPNQDNPLMDINVTNRGLPILGVDIWEHAYYLKYQNKRADYLDAFWSVLDWAAVEKKYEEALSTI